MILNRKNVVNIDGAPGIVLKEKEGEFTIFMLKSQKLVYRPTSEELPKYNGTIRFTNFEPNTWVRFNQTIIIDGELHVVGDKVKITEVYDEHCQIKVNKRKITVPLSLLK